MKQPPRYSNQRVGIFVDVQNLYHSAKNLYHGRVNYSELMKHLTGERQLIRAMAYVVNAIRMSEFLDVIILVTGDGDFLPLVDYLKWGAGRLVEVAAFRRSASAKIQEAADRFINVEDIPRAIMRSRG